MNRLQQDERERQLRKAAILVASLDDAMAERVLSDLPAADAQAVRFAVARLDSIDPDEQSDVCDQFRRSTRSATPRHTDAVELDASLLARLDEPSRGDWQAETVKPSSPWSGLSDAETATIVEALSQEHPQTAAIVISRLEPAAAAQILGQLPVPLQTDVLGRLAHLDPADEHSVKVVESQLSQWITRQRERKERLAAGAELVGRILESTPAQERTVILARLGSANPELALRVGQPAVALANAPPEPTLKPRGIKKLFRPARAAQSQSKPATQAQIADPLAELEEHDDATLVAALTRTSPEVVTLALAGASDELLKRVLSRLPRRQAKQFRKSLREIPPTRLSDMLAAQQELAQQARRFKSS